MKRTLILLYGIICYAIFFATFLYAIGFIEDLWVPKSMDSPRESSLATALLTDLGLLALFAIQHSVMARPAFKRWWTKWVPESAERSTYTLLSSVALIAMFAYWQPLGGAIWSVTSATGQTAIYVGYAFGWALLLMSSFAISHFDLFGLRQVWLQFVGAPYQPVAFRLPWLYRQVRHPLYVGWLFIFWSTPTMTVTHLVFALATTAYIFIGIQFEERDLVASHPEYAEYRRRVPMLVPRIGKSASVTPQTARRGPGQPPVFGS